MVIPAVTLCDRRLMIPENKYFCAKMWKIVSSNFELEMGNFQREKTILASFPYYQNQQHLDTGVYYIRVDVETILEQIRNEK